MGSVLVIDDDDAMCAALANLLTVEGYSCVAASDGEEGLRLLAARPRDLVIVDFNLRDMDAVEFLRRKAANSSVAGVPVLVIAVSESVPLPDGAVVLLYKPFALDELLDEVRKHVGRPPEPQ